MSQRTEITRFQFYICMGYKYNLFLKPNSWTFSFSQCCYFALPAVSADGIMGEKCLHSFRVGLSSYYVSGNGISPT